MPTIYTSHATIHHGFDGTDRDAMVYRSETPSHIYTLWVIGGSFFVSTDGGPLSILITNWSFGHYDLANRFRLYPSPRVLADGRSVA